MTNDKANSVATTGAAQQPAAPVVVRAEYTASAVKKSQYPEKKLPEIVFIGRSNVGKSSLINSLTRVNNLARVSKKPGKTQTINFFAVTLKKNTERRDFYLVDLPGYGYAQTGRQERNIWAKFIEEYLVGSPNIKFVAQLLDIRHELMKHDEKMFRWLVEHNLPVLPIATKADKVGKNVAKKNVAAFRRAFGIAELSILPYSSEKNEGRSELLDTLWGTLV